MKRKTSVRSYERRDGTPVKAHDRLVEYSEGVPLVSSKDYKPPLSSYRVDRVDDLVGQTFYTSWGYDQTNYDFIVVKSVSPTGKTVVAQRAKLASNKISESGQYWNQIPSSEGFGDEFRLKVDFDGNGEITLRGSYPYASDGRKERSGTRFGYFRPTEPGTSYAETDIQFGH
jgi:hypothetical protein